MKPRRRNHIFQTIFQCTLLALTTSACVAAPRAVHALDGRALGPLPVDMLRDAELEHATELARTRLREQPTSEDAFVWLGRRLAYQGAYYEAIGVFSKGLAVHPDSARLRRHRGHRYITVREFEAAVQDLEVARDLASGQPDVIEEDGAPNAAGIPRSTLRGNIHYHLGLAYYLLGQYDAACREYRQGLELAQNDDTLVSTGWWLYLASRRRAQGGGAPQGAKQRSSDGVLQALRPEMEILENTAYHRLLLMARGDLAPDEVLPSDLGSIQGLTLGYGVAAYDSLQGRPVASRTVIRRVLQSPWWSAFGYIAAEADTWRATRLADPTGIGP